VADQCMNQLHDSIQLIIKVNQYSGSSLKFHKSVQWINTVVVHRMDEYRIKFGKTKKSNYQNHAHVLPRHDCQQEQEFLKNHIIGIE